MKAHKPAARIPPPRLAFTWGIAGHSDDAESLVTIDIRSRETGCRLTLTHHMDRKWADFAGRTKAGWTKMPGVLEHVLREGQS